MRKTFTLTLLACFTACLGFGQNWEAFTSGRTYHYRSDTAMSLPDVSVHFDSIEVLGADSAFSVARRFVFPVDTSQRNQPMFCGREIRAFSNGVFNFKSPLNVGLPTHAGLGQSFTLDSISGLSAAVTRVDQTTILGVALDSVKVFTTLALDSIVLSKAHGLLEWPASLGGARFVLTGIQEEQIGELLPDFDAFFGFPAGADFYYESSIETGDLLPIGDNFRVKFHVDTAQRVMGGVNVTWTGIVRHQHYVNMALDSTTISLTGGTFMIEDRTASILQKSHHEQVRAPKALKPFKMPEPWATYMVSAAVDSTNSNWTGLWTTMTFQRNAGKTELRLGRSNGAIGWLYYGIGGDTCAASNLDQIRATFREGFGITHVEWADIGSFGQFDLIGSIVNGDTSGTIISDLVLLATPNIVPARLSWIAYPNPASAQVQVQWNDVRPGQIQIMDLTGKVLSTHFVSGGSTSLDVSALAPGMYFLRLQQGSKESTKRISIVR